MSSFTGEFTCIGGRKYFPRAKLFLGCSKFSGGIKVHFDLHTQLLPGDNSGTFPTSHSFQCPRRNLVSAQAPPPFPFESNGPLDPCLYSLPFRPTPFHLRVKLIIQTPCFRPCQKIKISRRNNTPSQELHHLVSKYLRTTISDKPFFFSSNMQPTPLLDPSSNMPPTSTREEVSRGLSL